MGYALIWIESLAAALLFVAVALAFWSRRPLTFWGFVLIPPPLFLVVTMYPDGKSLVEILKFAIGTLLFFFQFRTVGTLSWLVLLLLGTAILMRIGLKRSDVDRKRILRAWPLAKLVLACLVTVMVTCITFNNLDLALMVQLSTFRAEAGSTIARLTPPKFPDSENAAFVYREAFELMALPTQYPTSWKDKTSMLGNIDLVAIDPTSRDSRAFLTSQSKVLELLRKASAMPGCDFEHDYSRGIYLLIPEQGQIRESVLLLFIDSVVKASDGDSCGAMENVRAIYGLGRHACEPILVSLVTALTYEEVAKRSLELILNQASPHPSVLCENELEGFRPYHDLLRRALKMEEALFGLTTFGLGLTGADQDTERQFVAASIANLYPQESELIGTLVFSAVWRVFFMPYDLSQYRRFMRDAEAALARPLWEAKAQLQEIERSTVKCRERGGIITGLVAPAISRVADRAAEGDANRYLVRLALAAKRYQLKKGNFPAKIDDLVPSFIATIPIDPFDGQPIRMKHDGKDLVFYSIGRDGKDDGGVAKDPGNRDLDLVFRLRGKE